MLAVNLGWKSCKVNAVLANIRCEFQKKNHNVKYYLPALPLEKFVLLKNRTATEISYQSYAACFR